MFRIWFKKIFLAVFELVIVAGAVWYVYEKNGLKNIRDIVPIASKIVSENISQKPFPEKDGQVERKFDWTYKKQKYSLSLELYQSIYEYYKSQPKQYSYSGELPSDWENQYYGMFLKNNENDRTIIDLAGKLRALGLKHGLSDDQIVEMTLAFVQTIPYDDAKAKNILANTGTESMLYPYELLYDQKGVCSDKSFLASALLREMGYGTTLFVYKNENHMAIGIQCPKEYSAYGSGYCYGETTTVGNKIGIIPDLDPANNKTAEPKIIDAGVQSQENQPSLKKLSEVALFQSSIGKQYSGIVLTKKIESEIVLLKTKLSNLLSVIESQKQSILTSQSELAAIESDLKNHENDTNYEKYNVIAKKYNKQLEIYKADVKTYNNNVALYNKTVEMYNTLIRQ
jgi:hypothetical protein